MRFFSFLFLVKEVVVPVKDATAKVQKDVQRDEKREDKLLTVNEKISDSTCESNQNVDYPDAFKSSNKDSPEGHVVVSESDRMILTLDHFRWQQTCLTYLLISRRFSPRGWLQHYLVVFIKFCNLCIMFSFLLRSLSFYLVDAQVEEDLNAVHHPENVD